ncbi:MAG: TerB N-terminal domain-containing protein [Oscillospiraceae bacterium]|nr:TerB N-terminal domain-containing protein [Oscillospiraceae bacterium]
MPDPSKGGTALDFWELTENIFSLAQAPAAGEDAGIPEEKSSDPEQRIHAMRKIKAESSPFARLYGGKDKEQFLRQAEYMADFEDDYHKPAACHSDCPCYAEMTTAQLRSYFTWRTKYRRGQYAPAPRAFVLLHAFELLNGIGVPGEPDPETLAEDFALLWRSARGFCEVDRLFCVWFKDLYLCNSYPEAFAQFARRHSVAACYENLPPLPNTADFVQLSAAQIGALLRKSIFLREHPEYRPVLETAFCAALRSLAPLFTLHGVSLRRTLLPEPERFVRYEPFRHALVRVTPPEGRRSILISPSEVYRCANGAWQCASSHHTQPEKSLAAEYIFRLIEDYLRAHCGHPKSGLSLEALLERWLRSTEYNVSLYRIATHPSFAEIVEECAEAAMAAGGTLSADYLVAQAREIAGRLAEEPFRTFVKLQEVPGGHTAAAQRRQFRQQAKLLADLTDSSETVVFNHRFYPSFAQLDFSELHSYVCCRTMLREDKEFPVPAVYVILYCYELLSGIGTRDPFGELCRVLRCAVPLDKTSRQRVAQFLVDWYLLHRPAESFTDLLRRHRAERFFPEYFLFREEEVDPLTLWEAFSTYKLSGSRFYSPAGHAPLRACFQTVLAAAAAFFEEQGVDFRQTVLLRGKLRESHFPFDDDRLLAVRKPHEPHTVWLGEDAEYFFTGKDWLCRRRPRLSLCAPALAGFLLKRMEARLRQTLRFPYKLTAEPRQMLFRASAYSPKLQSLLCAPDFARAIDRAVETFAQTHDLQVLLNPTRQHKQRARKNGRPANEERGAGAAEPAKPIKIDFSRLPQIRAEAAKLTEKLIVEEAQEESPSPPQEAAALSPPEPHNFTSEAESWKALRAAMDEAQLRLVDFLCGASGLPPHMDELLLEEINELALEYIGDTLFDAAAAPPALFEEYRTAWKNTR